MKNLVAVVLVIHIAVCLCQKYTSRYDSLNLDQILSNKRVLNNYVKCVLDEGPCTAEGRELKAHIPEAIQTNCVKCTETQKNFVRRGAKHLIKNNPKEWMKIARKYDPKGQYANQFNQFLGN
ncbi:ejaculatory bulb-specific protein 3-like [Euwallacea similis]|uniref:ejaculatory bulb-specific protein 3-like n=1 Tax=Euwallacea similis TaxID=1736056 RepID=UPI00344F7D98